MTEQPGAQAPKTVPHTHPEPVPDGPELSRHLTEAHHYSSSNALEDFDATHRLLHARMSPDDTAPITISIEIELDLSPDEAWPNKDWPTGWKAQDVVELFKTRTAEQFIEDWDMLTLGADVTVHARGEFARVTLR